MKTLKLSGVLVVAIILYLLLVSEPDNSEPSAPVPAPYMPVSCSGPPPNGGVHRHHYYPLFVSQHV